ncbi:Sec-independent protein translocase protein TatB [Ponticaulis sp.]|uniref:Sec-independent protein translocase protein TatB n=1 Tax=Ponticaulis sp. TaxID=2020902 RepID=UPI000B6550E6|nr:Sec-independent protein translocase protein TatB [Ponticaulis sp.]MAI92095.1 twin-arginine translocase subunit TatB [Ponticaulis sp.]OUX96269.1 MAG: twin-arginine translocase subunit TatB [Hyphomonadaceae bacterium TMED5]|tara:strand:+ start:64070 stop:64387 length:318 start_codon:yes stop_codon:yes gene_type:complete
MLPQFGLSEFLLIGVVALIVVGPKDLPLMMRRLGQWVGQAKRMANEFRGAFDDIARQAELDELRKEIEDLKKNNQLEQAVSDLKDAEREINTSVMSSETSGERQT